ncbi:MAG: right-handed parallel beta-helix repeat-containing protein, partial [Planctomycetota bacterium]
MFAVLCPAELGATDLYVNDVGEGGSGTESDPYLGPDAIQVAINEAGSGDVIHVAGGFYDHIILSTPTDFIIIEDNNWAGGDPGVEAKIDGNMGNGIGIWIKGGQSRNMRICGLTVSNWTMFVPQAPGIAIDPPDSTSGSSPTIMNCTIEGNINTNLYGPGGLSVGARCNPLITDCVFNSNENTSTVNQGMAGAIMITPVGEAPCPPLSDWPNPEIRNCTFNGNKADGVGGRGGAIVIECAFALITGCTFQGNIAMRSGGAIYTNEISAVTIQNCKFGGNIARRGIGGAIYANGSGGDNLPLRIIGNTFSNNRAARAGALCVANQAATVSHNNFENNRAEADPNPMLPPSFPPTAGALGIRGKD